MCDSRPRRRAGAVPGVRLYGEQAEVKEALQAATMWNYIYTPAEYGPFLPVSRAWNFVKGNVNLDWAYVIFDWDNTFGTATSRATFLVFFLRDVELTTVCAAM